jgi:hypothetical protein
MRFGYPRPLAGGLLLAAAGLAAVRAGAGRRHVLLHVLPGMLLLGVGAGTAFNPVLLAAMSDVRPEESGWRRAWSTPRS